MRGFLICIVCSIMCAGCATDYPSPPTHEEVEAYRKWRQQRESDEFFGRRKYKIGPFRFGPKAKRHPANYEDNW